MWLKISYFIGLTNLTDEQVDRYFDYLQKARASRRREEQQYTAEARFGGELTRYAIETLGSLVVFSVFVGTSIVVEFVAQIAEQLGIIFRIAGWLPAEQFVASL